MLTYISHRHDESDAAHARPDRARHAPVLQVAVRVRQHLVRARARVRVRVRVRVRGGVGVQVKVRVRVVRVRVRLAMPDCGSTTAVWPHDASSEACAPAQGKACACE